MISRRGLRVAVLCCSAAFVIGGAGPAMAVTHHHRRHHRRHRHRTTTTLRSRSLLSQPCPDAQTPVGSASLSAMRAAVLCLINQERGARGLATLGDSAKLDRLAQNWAQHMVATGDFTHPSNFAQRFSLFGYDWQAIGENIATGYTTPSSVVQAWMASREHCRNILDPTYRDVGTGAVAAAVGAVGTLPGSWTEDFGLTMTRSALSRNTRPQNGCPY